MTNIYKTIQGDTWDSISYRVYGSEFYTNELFIANPAYHDFFIFSSNISITVPDIDVAINTELPPWERTAETASAPDKSAEDMRNILSAFNPNQLNVLSYRYVDRYTARMIAATKKGF